MVKAFVERLRDSLFFVPALFIAGGVGLAFATATLDSSVPVETRFLPTSPEGTRAILATVAAASATVAALVFSITAVTVQLAASQYSPRLLQGFLRDRFQQVVVGVVVGTFSYALVGLAAVGPSGADAESTAWTALTGTGLGVAVIIGIVAFIDHVTRRIRVDDTIRRLSVQTATSMESWFGHPRGQEDLESWNLAEETIEETVEAAKDGWVQGVDPDRIVAAVPSGAIARVDVRVGARVNRGDRLVTVWHTVSEDGDGFTEVAKGVQIGQTRTIAQDPGFGIRQLVDIALRALSPGINDPTTAADVIHHLVAPLRPAVLGDPRRRVITGSERRRVVLYQEPDQDDLVREAFTEIRLAAGRHPIVGRALMEALGSLRRQVAQLEGPRRALPVIDEQLRLAADEIASWHLPEPDLRQMLHLLRTAGVIDTEGRFVETDSERGA